MATLRKCLVLTVLLAVPAAAAPAEARGGGGCGEVRRVLERNAVVKVFWGPRDADDRRLLCAKYRGRRPLRLSETSLDAGPDDWWLAGRFVFLTEQHFDRGTGDVLAWASLADVRARRWRHQWEFYALGPAAPISFGVVRLLRSGSVAFSVSGVDPDVEEQRFAKHSEIHRAMGPYQDELAGSAEVDAASLRFSEERMHWTEGGSELSAVFF